jgi:hypothetical protein
VTDDDLDLIETERLVDALGRRCESLLFVEVRNRNGTDGAAVWWRGGFMAALGACRYAEHFMLSEPKKDFDTND